MTVPATNCVLLQVAGPGALDRYGEPASRTTAWTGSVRGYLRRPRMARTGEDRERDVRDDQLVLQGTVARGLLAALSAGPDSAASDVLVRDERGVTPLESWFIVKGLQHIGVGTVADSVRLDLRREAAA